MCFLSKLWEIRKGISIVPATSTICPSIVCKRFRRLAKLWCTQPWEVASKSIRFQSLRRDHCKPKLKKVLITSWIQQLKSILSKWTRFKRREPNPLLRQGWQIWCQTSSRMEWTNTRWQTVLWQLKIMQFSKTLEEHRVSRLLKGSMECK